MLIRSRVIISHSDHISMTLTLIQSILRTPTWSDRGHAVHTNTGSHLDHHNGLRHQGDPPGSYIADLTVPWDTLADNLQTEVGSIPIWIPQDAGVMCYSEHSPDPSVQVTSFLTPANHQSQSHDWDIKDTGYCRQDIDKFKQIYNHVLSSGQPNYCGARIIIPSGLNIPIWREYLSNSCYHDVAVCDMLAYGFPLNYRRDVYPITIPGNHPSAVQFPGHVDTYLDTEIRHGALLGPFTTPPIANVHISPLMSRPKRQSSLRRTILDLSWPIGYSVNSGIPTDTYLGEPYKLHLPTIDDLVQLVLQQGHGCYLYSHDISRAYRQIRCCPLDWALLGIQWRNMYYLDIAIPFGVRIAPWHAPECRRQYATS